MINLNDGYTVLPALPKYQTGDVIKHRLYEYRGLIVEIDSSCQAEDAWYQSNQTKPDRNQAWYHILVDGNQQVTYVAESNIDLDQSGNPIVHPLLNLFFYGVDEKNNKYLRNDIPFNPGKPPDALPPPPPEDPPSLPPTNIA
mgnify:FL=1|jgi:heat shock protein HspQ